MELSFGEQIKILLNRNHMTIQDLADRYEQATGNKMSRQNLTQRLKRDNFPEQDMHIFAALLGYQVSIQLEPTITVTCSEYGRHPAVAETAVPVQTTEPVLHSSLSSQTGSEQTAPAASDNHSPESGAGRISDPVPSLLNQTSSAAAPDRSPTDLSIEIPEAFRKQKPQADINPLTGQEYLTNTVRRHPDDPDYIQVYDQMTHSWSDVEESYFWDFQQKKKQILGKDYQEPLLI